MFLGKLQSPDSAYIKISFNSRGGRAAFKFSERLRRTYHTEMNYFYRAMGAARFTVSRRCRVETSAQKEERKYAQICSSPGGEPVMKIIKPFDRKSRNRLAIKFCSKPVNWRQPMIAGRVPRLYRIAGISRANNWDFLIARNSRKRKRCEFPERIARRSGAGAAAASAAALDGGGGRIQRRKINRGPF